MNPFKLVSAFFLCVIISALLLPWSAEANSRWDRGLFIGHGAPHGQIFTACLSPEGDSMYGWRSIFQLKWTGEKWDEYANGKPVASWKITPPDGGVHIWRTGSGSKFHIPINMSKIYLAQEPKLHCKDWLPGPPDSFLTKANPGELPLRAISVTAGTNSSCAITSDRTLRCWGNNSAGTIGADRGGSVSFINLQDVRQVSMATQACALLGGGEVACWGGGPEFPAGDDPMIIPHISAAGISQGAPSCLILRDLTVSCFDRIAIEAPVFHPVPGLSNVKGIHAGGYRGCAVNKAGEVYCWGRLAPLPILNEEEASPSYQPVLIKGINNALNVASGFNQDCAALADGTIKCWSYPGQGKEPDFVTLPIQNAVSIGSGNTFACALLRDGTVSCWRSPYMKAGLSPTSIIKVASLSNAMAMSVGAGHACALTHEGGVLCWGDNNSGELGVLSNLGQPVDDKTFFAAHAVFGFVGYPGSGSAGASQ